MAITARANRFRMKDYADHGRSKIMELAPVEFLRRFSLHILPKGFVKIRYFGICSAAWQQLIELPPVETPPERVEAANGGGCETGPGYVCPFCEKGRMRSVAELPRIRSSSTEWLAFPRRNYAENTCRRDPVGFAMPDLLRNRPIYPEIRGKMP